MRLFGKNPKNESETPAAAAVRTIYVCAKELDELVGEVAHPAELLQHERFRQAALELARGSYSDDELLTYGWSDNATIAALALAALAERPARAEAVTAARSAASGRTSGGARTSSTTRRRPRRRRSWRTCSSGSRGPCCSSAVKGSARA